MKFEKLLFCICFIFSLTCAVSGANYTVTKIADTNDGMCAADCSLREAVAAANATADNDFIYFALPLFAQPQTITLSGSEIVVANNGSLTIYGTGANRLTISGNNASRILASGANVVVNLHHMRFTGGNGVGATNSGRGGAIYNVGGTMLISKCILIGNSAANGGAINNAASSGPAVNANLTIADSWLTNNSSTSSGAAMQNFSTSTLHLRNSTVSNNMSSGTGIAGAFQANGTVTITNSTFSANSTAGTGGGVYYNGSSMIMTNTTLAGNSSPLGGGGLHRTGTNPTLIMRNTIVANNTGAAATPDAAGLVTSQGNNIIGAVGTSTGWVMSDLQNTNPLLSPLGFYGGIGYTHAPMSVSQALNGGQNCVTDLSCATNNPPVAIPKDQRGAARIGNVDIGAFEFNTESYTAILPSAQVNVPYNTVLAPNVGAFTYSHSGGTLPPGVTVNTGAVIASVNGTPTQLGGFNFGVVITDTVNSALVKYRLNVLSDLSLVPVSGRVINASGTGIPKTTVVFTDQNGNVRTSLTNGFGYFILDNMSVGLTYTVTVASKQYTFTPQVVTIVDYIDDVDFVALP